jgi:hypothetical protein
MDAHPAMKEFVLTKVMRYFFSTERVRIQNWDDGVSLLTLAYDHLCCPLCDMIVGAFVLPPVIARMIDASAIRRLVVP